MHAMFDYVLRPHWKKCSSSHMQSDERVRNLAQNFRCEMQTSGGGGNSARRLSKNSLVTHLILLIACATNVRRQWHRTTGIKIDIFIQHHDALTTGRDVLNLQNGIVDLC